jgi:predicted RNase H-like HicB family nuclease
MALNLTAAFRQVPEGYIGFVEELPGANTQGSTLDEARKNLQEAVELVLEANRILAEEDLEDSEVIEHLAAIEEDTRAELRGIQKTRETARQVRKLLQELPKSAPGRRELLAGVERPLARMESWIEAAEVLLPAYRDTRWKLMALRADHEDPGNAPVFDDPDQLDRYLAS